MKFTEASFDFSFADYSKQVCKRSIIIMMILLSCQESVLFSHLVDLETVHLHQDRKHSIRRISVVAE